MSRPRLHIIVVVLLLATACVMARSVQIMVLEHGKWLQRARRQHERVMTVPGLRGDIVTSDGYVLATSVERWAVQLDTQLLSYPDLFVSAAAPLLGVDENELRQRVESGPRALWLAQRAEIETAEAVRALAPDAVVLVPDAERVYPLGSLAAPVVGFVGREELRTVGRAGFEHHLDDLLAGEPETYLAVNDAVQRRLRLERLRPGHPGFDLGLTLNARLQAICEAQLARALSEQRARGGSVVVMEVDTGVLLALVSLPSFDPRAPASVPPERWRLRPVQDAYEPGSLVKPVVAAAALASGVVRSGERFDCRQGGTTVAGRWIKDHAEPGVYTLDEIVAESANAGIIQIAERVPSQTLWRTFDAFGFGRRPEVDFPAEASGILPSPESWSALSKASLGLGQELTASPLQIAVAYAAIANGGWLVRPRLLSRPSDPAEGSEAWRWRVLDGRLSQRLSRMLESVITDGTGVEAAVAGYRVAGKTGTAQRAVDGSFDDRHHVSWFAGFLPEPEPRLVVVVSVEDPVANIWGGTVAAPVFARIAEAAVCLLGLAPNEEPELRGDAA